MNYHKRILNIPCMPESDYDYKGKEVIAYKKGFTDVKEPAAEIANEAEGVIEELLDALEQSLLAMIKMEEALDGEFGSCRSIEQIDQDGDTPECITDARAAIAKARGEKND